MRSLPPFAELWSHYPRGDSSTAKATIGGNINMDWVTNTCVVRVCHALIMAGFEITSAHGLTTARGGNGKRYGFRVSEFEPYLRAEVGPPTLTMASPKASHFGGMSGIICFEVSGWSDATGHFDLWNGSEAGSGEYFSLSHEAHIWVC
jgi:hypothetical protein